MSEDIDKLNKKRAIYLSRAEWFDAWRAFPRILVGLYGAGVGFIVHWFINIETHLTKKCDSVLLNSLLDRDISLVDATDVACSIIAIVGGPTTQHTILVTTISGLATAVFAFYTSSGRDWSKSVAPWNFGKSKNAPDQE